MSHESIRTDKALGREPGHAAGTRGARIVVVDNDPGVLSLLIEILEDCGWNIIPCDEAQKAGESIRRRFPDLILLDIWLDSPEIGWELLGSLKRDPITRAIPVIVCSAAIDHLARGEASLKEYEVTVVTKPFNVDDLCRTVGRVLAQRGSCGDSRRSA